MGTCNSYSGGCVRASCARPISSRCSVHTLVELSKRYAPPRHPAAWRLLALECAGDAGAGAQSWSAAALVAQVLRLARSLRFGLDLRFQAHTVLFASRLLHAITLLQASLRALALAETFRVVLLTQTQTQPHEASPPSASTVPATATTRWETMLHECYVREWWLLDEAPALTELMDALLQHLLRLLALFPAVT